MKKRLETSSLANREFPGLVPVSSRAASSELLSAFCSDRKQGRDSDLAKILEKKGHSFVPRTPRLGAADAAKKRAAFRSPEPPLAGDGGISRQAQRFGGVGKASEPPHSLRTPRCLTDRPGGWWLLVTHQLSLEQSSTSSASLDRRAKTQSLPPQARSSWCAH